MGEFLFWLITLAMTGYFAFELGVRRERGRQMRWEEINRPLERPRTESGVRLKRIKLSRSNSTTANAVSPVR